MDFLHCKPTRLLRDHQHSDNLSQTCVASVGAASMQASFVGLPDLPSAVLKDILEQVSLLDKLAGEQVCKSWRQAVQNPQIWVALYGTRWSTILIDSIEAPGYSRDGTGISDLMLQGSKSHILQVAVPSLRSPHLRVVSVFGWLAAGQL